MGKKFIEGILWLLIGIGPLYLVISGKWEFRFGFVGYIVCAFCVFAGIKAFFKGANSYIPKIHDAIISDRIDKVEKILEKGEDINYKTSDNLTPLYTAIMMDRKDIILLLLEKAAEVNVIPTGGIFKGRPLLHLALTHLSNDDNADVDLFERIIETIVKKGADINAKIPEDDKHFGGKTPLMIAEEKGYTKIVDFLKSKSANS